MIYLSLIIDNNHGICKIKLFNSLYLSLHYKNYMVPKLILFMRPVITKHGMTNEEKSYGNSKNY